jgi:hypothetical protein
MSQENPPYPFEQEFSFKKLVNDRFSDIEYILRFKKLLAIAVLIGALAGAFIAWYKKPTYTARLTFVVDDAKSSGAGGLSSLAGQFGVNLGGLSNSGGVLAGDNVQELVKSRKLIKATLLSAYDNTQTLADKYAQITKLNKKWLEYSPDGKIIRFPLNGVKSTRLQDSLLHEMIILVLDGDFGIAKSDKKLDFFELNTTMKDERLSQLFCIRMLKQSTDFYISTKTKKLRDNVARLQHRADSIGALLNRKTYSVSSANQNIINLNPAYTAANANIEVKQRDKVVLSTIFSETVKNLEASKTMLFARNPYRANS